MSFSSRAKDELIRLPLDRPCCTLSELSALTEACGSLGFQGGGRMTVTYRTENTALARRLFRMLRQGLSLSPALQFVEHARLGGRRSSVLTVAGADAAALLTALRMMEPGPDGAPALRHTAPRPLITRQCCRRAYLRGAFLGAGAITSPEKGYHFEIAADSPSFSQTILRQLERSGLPARSHERRGRQVVYLKGAQHIADALALMGAPNAVMELENMRITLQMRGNANRASNCDEHNTERALSAGERQIEAIKLISIERGLFTLPPALQELARARLEHPELALQELGLLLDPPVTKSGVANRFRRILEEARRIEEEHGADGGGASHPI